LSSSARARVELATPQGPLELKLYDHTHTLVASGFGQIERSLRPGLYRLEVHAGSRTEKHFITVGPSGLVDREITIDMPSAAPIGGTSTVHEFHGYPASQLSRQPQGAFGYGGRLVVFVRNMGENPQGPVDVDSVSVFDARNAPLGTGLADFHHSPGEGWAGLSVDVQPGGYILRQTRPRRGPGEYSEKTVDQSIWVAQDWITLVFVPFRDKVGYPQPEFASVHMARHELGFDPYDQEMQAANVALEIALSGLRGGRANVPRDLEQLMLRGKFGNPMLGIVGALGLLHADKTNWRLFDIVRRNLKRLVPEHPDVQALHVMGKQKREDERESRVPAATWPPMLYACYRGLIDRDSDETRRLIPEGSIADHAASRLLAQGPWTRWRAIHGPAEEARDEQLDKRIKSAVDQLRSIAAQEGETELVAQLRHSWNEGVAKLDVSVGDRPRSTPATGISVTKAAVESMTPGTTAPEAAPHAETLRVASYLEGLAEQASKYNLPIPEGAFDVREISDQVGLPRATVKRALRDLVDEGLEF
jgi:hypothetical protein